MCSKRTVILGFAALALAGCNTANTHIGDEDMFLGEAVKYNAAAQIINPDPVYPPDGAKPGDNGDVGANAVERYRTDKVKKVEMMGTTTSLSGNGGSSPQN